MKPLAALLLAGGVLLAGCHHPPPRDEVSYSYYHAPRFDWGSVNRLLLLPLDNETRYFPVAEEVRQALAAELQQLGRFEVVPAPPDIQARLSCQVRDHGTFNEALMIQIARMTRADVILMGTVTQYHPYTLPRLGLTLQVISPGDAMVVASIDGLWDTAQQPVAERARGYYCRSRKCRDQSFTCDLALESPQLFQRFVCNEVARVLVDFPPPPPPAPPGPPEASAPPPAAKGNQVVPAPAQGNARPPRPAAEP